MGMRDFPNATDGFWQVKCADVAFYKAKESGYNRYLSFTTEVWDQKENF